MTKPRTKLGILIGLIYFLILEAYTLFNNIPNDTISEVMRDAGYEQPLLVVGAWMLLAAHWWWNIRSKRGSTNQDKNEFSNHPFFKNPYLVDGAQKLCSLCSKEEFDPIHSPLRITDAPE